MNAGPILGSELRTVARRAKTYQQRCSLAIALSFAIGALFAVAQQATSGQVSVQSYAIFAQYLFGAVAATQIVLTMWLVPALVAGAIVLERERRTLDSLLTTRLSSAEIVVGKLCGGLLQYAACLLTTLPIMILLCLVGGVDPRLVLLSHAATASLAFFAAALSILVSTSERRAVRAVTQTVGLATVWCILPALLQVLIPRLSPRAWHWIRPFNDWWLASSPNNVAETLLRSGIGSRLIDSIMWMIGLQLVAGCVLLAWSVARLRRASRRMEDAGGGKRGSSRFWSARHLRFSRRPPCGENPVLWKELHTSRVYGFAEVLGALVAIGVVGLIGFGTYHFGRPAFIELAHEGFGSRGVQIRRTDLNRFLSHVSSWVEFFMLLIVAGKAAGSVTFERARDTWDSLMATPLDGREILRAKMLGTIWKVRSGILLLVVLWSIGLLAGSLHPVAFGAAVVLTGVSIAFMASLGTYVSLISHDTAQASNRALIPALVLSCSFLVCYLPTRATTVFMGIGSIPFLNGVCLVTHGEIRDVLDGDETFRRLEELSIHSYESGLSVLVACLVSIAAFSAAAIAFHRAALNRFDRIIGRPERDQHEHAAGRRAWFEALKRRRKTVAVASMVVLFVISQISSLRSSILLRRALAETERLCPGWRLDDLEAARERVPDAENAALRVGAADHVLPASWRRDGNSPSQVERDQLEAVADLPPVQRLPEKSRRSLQAAIQGALPALAETRGLAVLTRGRFPITWASDGISTMLPQLAKVSDVANLVLADAIVESERGNADASLTACRAILSVGRSIGDEPALVSQRRRMDLREKACRQIERSLAQGQPSDIALAALERDLEAEEVQPLLVFGLRGERALMDRFLSAVGSGEFTHRQLRNAGFAYTDVLLWKTAPTRAIQLRFNNRAEQIATLPVEQQQAAFQQLDDESRNLPFASRMLVPGTLWVATACLTSRARLRCASTALACERYRLARGAWPSALEELVPRFLPRLPIDPFDGKPIRFRRENDHFVLYSVGEDRRDDGGRTEAVSRSSAGRDLEFRLWDPSRRRQSAPKE
jgi:ABC-type Na+ efflux pump permease subunit